MTKLLRQLVRPYRMGLTVILIAMLTETLMSLATPWPIKIILDNVAGNHQLALFTAAEQHFPAFMHAVGSGKFGVAGLAGALVLIIALLGSIASYIEDYQTE